MPEYAAAKHIEKEHGANVRQLIYSDTSYNTLTDNQKELLECFYSGMSDKEIANKLGISLSTVRHQKFTFREKAKQAKHYLAVFESVFNKDEGKDNKDNIITIHNNGALSDERFIITEQEKARILETCFESLVPLILKKFSAERKEKSSNPCKKADAVFTATMPPEVMTLAKSMLINPVSVAVTPVSSTVDIIEQSVYLTDKQSKMDLLTELMLGDESIRSALIFTRTKYGADKLSLRLKKAGIESMAIHGDKSQGARQNALTSFKNGSIRALVATDIAARGIDIEDLSHVINFELPNVPETYVHRIGRTGRAGKTGAAISLCDFDEKNTLPISKS
ncbi:atp-dependent rna helicase rhle-related [Holotrichia oblita]|nr:atp-dependent rna helicase rhle-related [Holotrichia oblita]